MEPSNAGAEESSEWNSYRSRKRSWTWEAIRSVSEEAFKVKDLSREGTKRESEEEAIDLIEFSYRSC